MLDDLSGLVNPDRSAKGLEDVRDARPTWPWAWLSMVLDSESFASLQTMALEAEKGGAPEALLRELGERMGPSAKRRARAFLDSAFARLAGALQPGAQLGGLKLEIERLERSYV